MAEPSRSTSCPRPRHPSTKPRHRSNRHGAGCVFSPYCSHVNWAAGDDCLATAILHYLAAAVSDRGRKRPSNEDAFGFSVEDGIYLVCDGMGGAAAGEIASSVAVDEVLHQLASRRETSVPLPEQAEKAVCAANDAIFSRAQRNYRLSGMGTTLVALVVEERHVWVLNVGDS